MSKIDVREYLQVVSVTAGTSDGGERGVTAFHIGSAYLVTDGHEVDARNAVRYVTAAYPGEPLFVIRGRDALAVPVLDAYAAECVAHGLNAHNGMAEQVYNHRARFVDWQQDGPVKLPDPYRGWPDPGQPDTEQPNR